MGAVCVVLVAPLGDVWSVVVDVWVCPTASPAINSKVPMERIVFFMLIVLLLTHASGVRLNFHSLSSEPAV